MRNYLEADIVHWSQSDILLPNYTYLDQFYSPSSDLLYQLAIATWFLEISLSFVESKFITAHVFKVMGSYSDLGPSHLFCSTGLVLGSLGERNWTKWRFFNVSSRIPIGYSHGRQDYERQGREGRGEMREVGAEGRGGKHAVPSAAFCWSQQVTRASPYSRSEKTDSTDGGAEITRQGY